MLMVSYRSKNEQIALSDSFNVCPSGVLVHISYPLLFSGFAVPAVTKIIFVSLSSQNACFFMGSMIEVQSLYTELTAS